MKVISLELEFIINNSIFCYEKEKYIFSRIADFDVFSFCGSSDLVIPTNSESGVEIMKDGKIRPGYDEYRELQ